MEKDLREIFHKTFFRGQLDKVGVLSKEMVLGAAPVGLEKGCDFEIFLLVFLIEAREVAVGEDRADEGV